MPRLLSVSLTTQQVRDRIKTQTRRVGWWTTKAGQRLLIPGDHLILCEKVMGRSRGEPLVRLAEVEVRDVRREYLRDITPEDVIAEGFPDLTPAEFIAFFCLHMKGGPHQEVTVIDWAYLDDAQLPIEEAS